jgi:hypothetical protein
MCIILFNFLAQILGGEGLVKEQFRKPRSKRPYSQELLGVTIPLPTLCWTLGLSLQAETIVMHVL